MAVAEEEAYPSPEIMHAIQYCLTECNKKSTQQQRMFSDNRRNHMQQNKGSPPPKLPKLWLNKRGSISLGMFHRLSDANKACEFFFLLARTIVRPCTVIVALKEPNVYSKQS